jgi:hypothetical protein
MRKYEARGSEGKMRVKREEEGQEKEKGRRETWVDLERQDGEG